MQLDMTPEEFKEKYFSMTCDAFAKELGISTFQLSKFAKTLNLRKVSGRRKVEYKFKDEV